MKQKLYQNKSDKWGTEAFEMTRDGWRTTMLDRFTAWFKEEQEENEDLQDSDFTDWVEEQLDSELEEIA